MQINILIDIISITEEIFRGVAESISAGTYRNNSLLGKWSCFGLSVYIIGGGCTEKMLLEPTS